MTTKATVLFVDDEERITKLLKAIFRADYDVHTANSAAEGLQVLQAQRIDVVVSDQRMPGMMGTEFLSEVRKRSPRTMRILLTGYSDLGSIVGSVNDGEVFRFINKPWNQDEIKSIIAQAAAAAQMTPELSPVTVDSMLPLDANGEQPQILLLDDSVADMEAMKELIKGYTIHSASSMTAALQVLAENSIGVIVSEARVSGSDTGELLRVLKQHYPAITTVILTRSADADLVVKLINGAQIFRFANKPIRPGSFQLAVLAAIKEHQRLVANPALTRRLEVAKGGEENTALREGVLKSMSRWGARLARMMS